MSENFEYIYSLVPEILNKHIGVGGLVGVVFGGSYAEKKWNPKADVDMDLIFESPLSINIALTLVQAIKTDFTSNKLLLDIRMCVDKKGNAIWIHNELKLLRNPELGKINLKQIYDERNRSHPATLINNFI